MTKREIRDSTTARYAGIEKVLRLFDETSGEEVFCRLREEWEQTEVVNGDAVNIIGRLQKWLNRSLS